MDVAVVLLVSPVIDSISRVLSKRLAFQLQLHRMHRWRTFEQGFFLLDDLVDPERAAVDVGANEGFYAGKMAWFTKKVHCFEPIPWLAEKLQEKLPATVNIHPVAVSNRKGPCVLRIPYHGDTELHGTTTIEPLNPLSGTTQIREIGASCVTLDEALQEPVGFVKIDVEGHEMAVLEGAQRIIGTDRPILMVESERRHHPDAPFNIFKHLEETGYRGLVMYKRRLFSLEGFSVDQHQRDVSRPREYANNFIFFPPP